MQPLNFGNGWVISTLEWACDYLDMLRLKSIHVKGPQEDDELTVYAQNPSLSWVQYTITHMGVMASLINNTSIFFQMLVQTNNKEPNYRL